MVWKIFVMDWESILVTPKSNLNHVKIGSRKGRLRVQDKTLIINKLNSWRFFILNFVPFLGSSVIIQQQAFPPIPSNPSQTPLHQSPSANEYYRQLLQKLFSAFQ